MNCYCLSYRNMEEAHAIFGPDFSAKDFEMDYVNAEGDDEEVGECVCVRF